jgi:WD40 repeat protein
MERSSPCRSTTRSVSSEVSTGRRLHHDRCTPVGGVASAAWSPAGDRVVIGHGDGFVRVWDSATGELIWVKTGNQVLTLQPSDGRASVMVFSPDGKRLFTGFGRGSAIVWNVLPGQAAPTARE